MPFFPTVSHPEAHKFKESRQCTGKLVLIP
jgi:hypothetical protein